MTIPAGDNETKEILIETGLSDPIIIEVISGLEEGEEVLEKPELTKQIFEMRRAIMLNDEITIQKYIEILEKSYIVFLLFPFYSNIRKRLIKTPKIYLCTTFEN